MKLRLAALALHLGLAYEAPGALLTPPHYERLDFDGPKLAVIATGKRTGKTAVAGHWAGLLRERGTRPVIVSMGRGGPPEPQVAEAGTSLADLRAIAADGRHAASDYLEDALIAGVTTVGCRRVGGGLVGEPFESNMAEGARLAASLAPDTLIFEGSGSCIPPLEPDATVCIVGHDADVSGLAMYSLLRSRLALVMGDRPLYGFPCPALRCRLEIESVEPLPDTARVAFFTTGAPAIDWLEPVVASTALARRGELEHDLERAAARALRRLPHRAQGRGHRHRGPARRSRRAPALSSCAIARSAWTAIWTRSCSTSTTMPETIVYNRERHGLPYSKGLMAQSLSASGISPERAYELARIVERRLDERTGPDIAVDALNDLVEEVLFEQETTDAVRRFHEWQRLDRLDQPLVVMLSGSTGVGKSTLATMLAARLGITRVIATDVIRQVLRAFFSREFMPVVHYSAFEAGKGRRGALHRPARGPRHPRLRAPGQERGHRGRCHRGARMPGAHAARTRGHPPRPGGAARGAA